MTIGTLILRSLRFHWRGHLGVLLGAAVGSAALIGALIVGDSVRESLRELGLQRLGWVHFALDAGDRHFREELAKSIAAGPAALALGRSGFTNNPALEVSAVLRLAASASTQQGEARANRVQLIGVDPSFGGRGRLAVFSKLSRDGVLLNEALAAQLRVAVGDTVLLRTRKPEALGGDSPITPQDQSAVTLRRRVQQVVRAEELGNFSLSANQAAPFNAFVSLTSLQEQLGCGARANLLLVGPPTRLEVAPPGPGRWPRNMVFNRPSVQSPNPPLATETNLVSSAAALPLLDAIVARELDLPDLQLHLTSTNSRNEVELRSERVFIDPPVADAVFHAATNNASEVSAAAGGKPYGVLTYLATLMRHGARATPYSMMTAAGPPLVPADLKEDEIIIHQWLADDLQAGPGSEIEVSWFVPDQAAQLLERTNRFRVRSVLPMTDPALDRSLMPDFPGMAQAEKAGDWQTGFPLTYKIRDQDDEYWKKYRGTPKAFVNLAVGQRLWGNRFGNLTAIRIPAPARIANRLHQDSNEGQTERALRDILQGRMPRTNDPVRAAVAAEPRLLDAAALGFRFQPVREMALAASASAQDFGGLFLGFSFFLILAALILMALLFQFGLEQRTAEIGILLALGFPPRRVRRLLLAEGGLLALAGGLLGVLGGVAYSRIMIRLLTTLWRDAVGTSALRFHVTGATLALGIVASVVVSALTIAWVLRKQGRVPARQLLAEGSALEMALAGGKPTGCRRALWLAALGGALALLWMGWALAAGDALSAETFFGAGALLLASELAGVHGALTWLRDSAAGAHPTLAAMGLRGVTRRRSRSLASIALLACGSFLVVAVGANRLEAGRDATRRTSGTGGFAMFGESALPVVRDLNTKVGREFYGLDEALLAGVSLVPFRVSEGDDASCLNLNRAQTPRLLGVKPELMAGRGAFTFAQVAKGLAKENPWLLLHAAPAPGGGRSGEGPIPAIGDAASIQWALGRKVGDVMTMHDERGRPFQLRLVAGLANSLLQGSLIIDEEEFIRRFPGVSGHRMFLIDTPSNTVAAREQISGMLSRALQDVGLELTPATQRLAAFNAVQNTYLNTFQVLGGLGLLLGSAGLAVVVLRNVLERRGELGLLQAVGFQRRSLRWLVLSEHGALLGAGLVVGLLAALAAIVPVLLSPGAAIHSRALLATLLGVFGSGLLWTWVATAIALRGRLLDALRDE